MNDEEELPRSNAADGDRERRLRPERTVRAGIVSVATRA
jgi:hypothetical protein